MKNGKRILTAFLTLGLVLFIVPVRVYADPPEINTDEIMLFRFPDAETEVAVSVPFGDAETLYYLLLKSTDTPPVNAAELKTNPDMQSEIRGEEDEPRLYLEWPSLELNTDYILYLAAENVEGLSGFVSYPFTPLPPLPVFGIDTITPVSETTAEVRYVIDGTAQTVYWMLIPEANAFNPTEADMQNANPVAGGSGEHTLELTGLTLGENYILKMMAEGANGLCSRIDSRDFPMTLPVPNIENVAVFGASATEVSVELAVDFGSLRDGKVYLSVLDDDAAEPAVADIVIEAEATGRVFDASALDGPLQLTGLTPETDYIVYCLAMSGGGPMMYAGVPFSTLEGGVAEPPAITISPTHMEITAGAEVSFHVQASGTGLYYQWQCTHEGYGTLDWKGGLSWINLENDADISGATADTLTIAASVAEWYYNTAFRCIVTNSAGRAFSEYAVLTVTGKWLVLRSVCGISVDAHHPIGQGLNMNNRFEAMVKVPHNITELAASDLTVSNVSSHTLTLYSGNTYTMKIPSQKLDEGQNDVYFTVDMIEGRSYYHVTLAREADNSDGGGDSGSDSSLPPTKADNSNSNPSTDAEDYPNVPQTGDHSDTGLWYTLLIASVLGIAGIVGWRKKQTGKGTWQRTGGLVNRDPLDTGLFPCLTDYTHGNKEL